MDYHICFWEGIKKLSVADAQEITSLINDYVTNKIDPNKRPKLKRVKGGTPLYTIDVNKQSRLLFTITEKNQNRYLIVLDYIEDHKYENSTYFNKKTALKIFIQKQIIKTNAEVNIDEFEDTEHLAITNIKSTYKKISNHGEQLIIWTEEQQQALQLNLPIIINGPAGSGKTAIAMEFLLNLTNSPNKVLYVAKSPLLIYFFKTTWESTLQNNELELHESFKIEFLTYEELILKDLEIDSQQLVDFEHFDKWYSVYNKISKKPLKYEHETIYNELKNLVKFEKLEEYKNSGNKWSLVTDLEDKNCIINIFRDYTKNLINNNKIDLNLMVMQSRKTPYDCVIADELQNLTEAQVVSLKSMVRNQQFLFSQDTNQTYETFIKQQDNSIPIIHLKETHRNTIPIAKLACKILQIKNLLLSGVIQVTDYTEYTSTIIGPEVSYLDNINSIENLITNNPNLAILTINPEIKKRFPKLHQIYTADEVIGLEFDTVILYEPFENNNITKDINLILKNNDLKNLKSTNNRTKEKDIIRETREIQKFINMVFICITRARKQLIIITKSGHHNENILQFLQPYNLAPTPLATININNINNEKNTKDWLELATRLVLSKEKKHAKHILEAELKYDKHQIQEFINKLIEPEIALNYNKEIDFSIDKYLKQYPEHKNKPWIKIKDEENLLSVLKLSSYIQGLKQLLLDSKQVENDVINNLNNLFQKPTFIYTLFYFSVDQSNLMSFLLNNSATKNATLKWFYYAMAKTHDKTVCIENQNKIIWELANFESPDPIIQFYVTYIGFTDNKNLCYKFWDIYKKKSHFVERLAYDLSYVCNPAEELPKNILHNIAKNIDHDFITEIKGNSKLKAMIKENELIQSLFFFVHNDYSPFYFFLTNTPVGIENIIYLHVETNLFKHINAKALFQNANKSDSTKINISPFLFLTTQAESGMKLLEFINISIKQTTLFSWQEICKVITTNPNHYHCNLSPFFYLSSNEKGIIFLMSKLNFATKEDVIELNNVMLQYSSNLHQYANTNALQLLVLSRAGRIFLEYLVNHKDFQDSILNQIDLDILTKPINSKLFGKYCDPKIPNSALFCLCVHDSGIKILTQFIQNNHIKFDENNIEIITGKPEISFDGPIFFLSKEYSGLMLLNLIIEKNENTKHKILQKLKNTLDCQPERKALLAEELHTPDAVEHLIGLLTEYVNKPPAIMNFMSMFAQNKASNITSTQPALQHK